MNQRHGTTPKRRRVSRLSQQRLETERAVVTHATHLPRICRSQPHTATPSRAQPHSRTSTPTSHGPSPSVSAGHRPHADLDEWGGWGSNPRPANYESRRPAVDFRAPGLGEQKLMRSWLPRFGHAFGMIMARIASESALCGISPGVPVRQLTLPHGFGGYSNGSWMSSRARSGCSERISSVAMPSATILTTGMRSPLMQGTPPMTSGSVVIRSNAIARC
jgi:hypothetical protein